MSSMETKEFVLAGVLMKRLLSGRQTNGQFCLFEKISGGNTKTSIHVHAEDDETIYLIEGELTAVVNGEAHPLTAGQCIQARGATSTDEYERPVGALYPD
jgi:mannose-6-phosphate isomerase-like protein (cupin superfamily)